MNKPRTSLLARLVPALEWLGSYDRTWLRYDAVGGLTASAVVVPQAMAYGAIAGLPLLRKCWRSNVRFIRAPSTAPIRGTADEIVPPPPGAGKAWLQPALRTMPAGGTGDPVPGTTE